jgi:hypothetical protein
MDEGDDFIIEEEIGKPTEEAVVFVEQEEAVVYPEDRTPISLYEFYALGIERLIVKAPWELERAVSAYHESFLTEQRCLGLSILLLLGENHVPDDAVQSMPGFENQARFSVNQAVFRRALKRYFEAKGLNPVRADMVVERMGSYITDSREAEQNQGDPLQAMFNTLAKRVPPLNQDQSEGYASRVEKIFDYVSGLVDAVVKRYVIVR